LVDCLLITLKSQGFKVISAALRANVITENEIN
jgi:hypothetical protein